MKLSDESVHSTLTKFQEYVKTYIRFLISLTSKERTDSIFVHPCIAFIQELADPLIHPTKTALQPNLDMACMKYVPKAVSMALDWNVFYFWLLEAHEVLGPKTKLFCPKAHVQSCLHGILLVFFLFFVFFIKKSSESIFIFYRFVRHGRCG